MNVLRQFQAFISTQQLFTAKDTLLLAVSGGMDSVVLCELCRQAGYSFVIAHCNFQLRGEESERDKEYVRQLALGYQVPFLVKDFDTATYAAAKKVSIQVAARELRYAWFYEIVNRQPGLRQASADKSSIGNDTPGAVSAPAYILTAHHLDDNIETLLMNFFKGTGIAGLRGMLPKQGKLVRPLLFAGKETLRAFAASQQLSWVEDSSNALDKYARNYIRHQVVPLLETIYPDVAGNLADNLARFRDLEVLYQQSIELHKKKLLEYRGHEIHIPVLKLKKAEPINTIVYEITREFGFSPQQATEIVDLLESESGKYVQSATHRVIKNRNWLIIAPLAVGEAQHVLIEGPAGDYQFASGHLLLSTGSPADCPPFADNHRSKPVASDEAPAGKRMPVRPPKAGTGGVTESSACVDLHRLQFPLLLRPWAAGDYFYPLGMKKKKKLARFLIDQKLSKTDKEKVWVLEMNKKIVWVIGMRIDDRFKISDGTTQVLRLELKTT